MAGNTVAYNLNRNANRGSGVGPGRISYAPLPNTTEYPYASIASISGNAFDYNGYRAGSSSTNRGKVNQSVALAPGRGNVIAPQRRTTLAVKVIKVQNEIRSLQTSANPTSHYGFFTKNEGCLDVKEGLVCLSILQPGSTYRQSLTADTPVKAVCHMGGIDRSAKLGLPGVMSFGRSQKEQDDSCTMAPTGYDTVIHTGPNPIQVGMGILVDPNPYCIRDEEGKPTPGVKIAGMPEDFQPPALRALSTTTTYVTVREIQNKIRVKLGKDIGTNNELVAAISSGVPKQLADFIQRMVSDMCHQPDISFAVDSPLRDILGIYVPWFLLHLNGIDGALGEPFSEANRPKRMRQQALFLGALRIALMRLEESQCRIVREFQHSLPHDLNDDMTITSESSVRSESLGNLLNPSTLSKLGQDHGIAAQQEALMQAQSRLNLFYDYFHDILSQSYTEYVRRLFLGTALSSANKAMAIDVFTGFK